MDFLFKPKPLPKEGHNYLREWEVNWLARVFEYYQQQGEFQIRLDSLLCIWVRFYSRRMMADLLIAPDLFQKLPRMLEHNGATVLRSSYLYPLMEAQVGLTGEKYKQALDDYRIG